MVKAKKGKTLEIFLLSILSLIFLILINSSGLAAAEDFTASAEASPTVCACGTYLSRITLTNTASDIVTYELGGSGLTQKKGGPTTYTISTQGDMAALTSTAPTIITINEGETGYIYNTITIPCDYKEKKYSLITNIQTLGGLKKQLKQEIEVKKCPNVIALPPEEPKACPCTLTSYPFIIQNTQKFADEFSYTVKPFTKHILLSEASSIMPGETNKTLYVYFDLPCSLTGEQNFTLEIISQNGNLKTETPFQLEIDQTCYDYELKIGTLREELTGEESGANQTDNENNGDENEVEENGLNESAGDGTELENVSLVFEESAEISFGEEEGQRIYWIEVSNLYNVTNTVSLELSSADSISAISEMAQLEKKKVELEPYEKEYVQLVLGKGEEGWNWPEEYLGENELILEGVAEKGLYAKNLTKKIMIDDYYNIGIAENNPKIVTNKSNIIIPVSVENKGSREVEIELSLEGPEWVSLNKTEIELNSEEIKTIDLYTNGKEAEKGSYTVDIYAKVKDWEGKDALFSQTLSVKITSFEQPIWWVWTKNKSRPIKNHPVWTAIILLIIILVIILLSLLIIKRKKSKKKKTKKKERLLRIKKKRNWALLWTVILVLGLAIIGLGIEALIIGLSYPLDIRDNMLTELTPGEIEAQIMLKNTGVKMNLSEYFKDPDNDTLYFEATSTEHIWAKLNQDELVIIPRQHWFGEEEITVYVTDKQGALVEESFRVQVKDRASRKEMVKDKIKAIFKHKENLPLLLGMLFVLILFTGLIAIVIVKYKSKKKRKRSTLENLLS